MPQRDRRQLRPAVVTNQARHEHDDLPPRESTPIPSNGGRHADHPYIKHVSAEMSLRYGRLFDSTVRTEYERALAAAKAHLGTLPTEPSQGRVSLPIVDGDWKVAPAIKARLAGGFCIRAQVQGPCAYANICEHCPNFRTDTGYLPVLAAQRADTETLARDAEARGWTGEAERHRRLIARLDAHISQTQTR